MYRTFKILILYIASFGCTSQKQLQNERIRAIHFLHTSLDVTNEGSIKVGVRSLRMYKVKDWRIIIAPGPLFVSDTDITVGTIMYYKHFIYNDSQRFGYIYDSISALSNKQFGVDSFIIKNSLYHVTPFCGLETLASSTDSAGVVIEKYIFKVKPNRTYCDTAYYYFNPAYNHFFYSFSDSLDKARKMKLYKYRFYYKADDPAKFEEPWPEKDFFWELKEAKVENEQELLDFIERHKKWLQSQPAK